MNSKNLTIFAFAAALILGLFHGTDSLVSPANEVKSASTTIAPTQIVLPSPTIEPATPTPTEIPPTPTRIIPTNTPVPTAVQYSNTNSGLSNNNYYENSQGNEVHSPAYSNTVPNGASAICGDGTYSFSQSRRGTCSHHGGVAQWL